LRVGSDVVCRHPIQGRATSVVMIALLAIRRKIIILNRTEADALHILALAAAIFALGII
jgi:uncharacterized membrane protein (DUF373 family)